MRRITGILAASVLATVGALTVAPGAAFATAPAPTCDSGLSHYICDAASTGTTVWTVVYTIGGNTTTRQWTTATPEISGTCVTNANYTVTYSGTYQGTNQNSGPAHFSCFAGQWR